MAKGGIMLQAAAVVLALCLVNMGAEGSCVVKNQSTQPVAIVPVGTAVEVVVQVGGSVELPESQQHCYIKNKHSGHQKGPVQLANGAIYAIVDAAVIGQVNLCLATVGLGGLLKIIVVVIASI